MAAQGAGDGAERVGQAAELVVRREESHLSAGAALAAAADLDHRVAGCAEHNRAADWNQGAASEQSGELQGSSSW